MGFCSLFFYNYLSGSPKTNLKAVTVTIPVTLCDPVLFLSHWEAFNSTSLKIELHSVAQWLVCIYLDIFLFQM